MKNVAILIPSLKPGGAEKQATLLATMLDKRYKVDMYLLYGDGEASGSNLEMLAQSGVQVHALAGNMLSKVMHLWRSLRENKVEVLFNYLTSCDVIGAIAGRLAGVKKIYGGIRNARLERVKMLADKIAHNWIASGTVYNCYSGAEYFTSKGYKEHKNIVIPNCFRQIAAPIIREDAPIKHLVTVGRFVPQKDYKTLIEMVAELKSQRQDFVLDIVGYGVEEEQIRTWIQRYDVADHIHIYIRPDNVQDIVRSADIYISTSLFEGTSNSIMEALNWSLPVVATNVGDNDRLVVEGKNGVLTACGDVAALALSVAKLLDSVGLRNQYGLQSNKNLQDNYSLALFEQRYIRLIEQE